MSTRHELTDEQWAVIEPLLPKPKPGPGRSPSDPRKTLNGILYVLKTGCTWADMPRQYGSPTTCWRRLKQWSEDGTWERIWRALLSRMDAEEKIEWAQAFLDGRFFPAKKGETGLEKPRWAREPRS
ncbi:IS5 family transposase [Planifilum fimeticola]|uniref:IS5 family transposase n=1 Tax=Planifilum fimeticola TaxID=201975 RepID=UPI000D06AEA7